MLPAVLIALVAAAPYAAQTSTPQTATPVTSAVATKAPAVTPKMVCKTSMETGSLVRRVRRCATADSWKRRTDGENDAARELVRANAGMVVGN